MGFKLRKEERADEGIRRLAGAQLRGAMEELRSADMEGHEAVHEARKRFKRIRAVLRLVRGPLKQEFRVLNHGFRDLGRSLSVYRDAEAVLETFDALVRVFDEQLGDTVKRHGREALAQRRDRLAGSASALHRDRQDAAAMLEELAPSIYQLPIEGEGIALIRKDLRGIYGEARRGMSRAYATGDPVHFHAWRKRVKDHWYHTQLLAPLWPELMKAYEHSLGDLSDVLGDHHNLVVFEELLREEQGLLPVADGQMLCCIIARRKQQLERDARSLGKLVLAEKPGAFALRVERYWKMWHAPEE